MAKTDYSLQLPDIAAPVKGNAGELYMQAGASQAKANALAGENTASAISFLGTAAIGAVKGKMESDLETEIKDATSKLEGFGDTAVRSAQNLRNVQDDLSSFNDNPPRDPEQIAQFGDEIKRFIIAQEQGILSRGEVISRISAAVKKFSADMPGWASDFRRIAAEQLNPSGLGALDPLHQALTKTSIAEDVAKRQMQAQLELDKQIASENGVGIAQITPQMRQLHYSTQQLKLAAARAQNEMQLTNLTRSEADRAWGQIYSMKLGAAATDLASDFAKLGALNSDPQKAQESSQFGLQLSTKIATLTAQMERDITEMSRPVPGRTPLSTEASQKLLSEWRATAKNWQDAAKEIEGRNFLGAAVKNAKDNVELLMSNFKLANPHLTVLNSYGAVSEIVKAWFAIGDKNEFNKRFPGLGEAMERVMTAPEYHASALGQVFGGQGVNLPEMAKVSPELAKVVASDMVASVKEWAKTPNPDPRRQEVFANTFGAFYSNPANFNAAVPRNIDEAYKTLSNPDVQRFLMGLTGQQRTKALLPMVGNLERTSFEIGQQIKAELAKWNDTDANLAAREGRILSIGRNSITGQFEVVEDRVQPKAGFVSNPAGAATGFMQGGASNATIDANAARKRATDLTGRLNHILETYTLGVRSLNVDGLGTTNLKEVQDRAQRGMDTGVKEPLFPGLASTDRAPQKMEATATVGSIDLERGADAIKAAERSAANSTSPRGAAGEYQFMPETAKQYGLKVDPKSGVDERRDSVKARSSAKDYLQKLSAMFKGEIDKVAAAYNAGEGSVQAAIAKAEQLGVPEMWQAFLPKPAETVPYIKRFVTAYSK